jgi:hypothetical protein
MMIPEGLADYLLLSMETCMFTKLVHDVGFMQWSQAVVPTRNKMITCKILFIFLSQKRLIF